MLKFVLLAVALTLTGCGKFLEKFSRLDEGYTRVELQGNRNAVATMNGGVMVIFARDGAEDGGSAFGFTSTELAMGRTVVVPNGSYKVYAFGAEHATNLLEGQAKCGLGNGGSVVSLSGGATTVSITMSAANCAFGTNSVFADPDYVNSGNTNFDTLNLDFCSTQAYPSCDTNASATYSVRFRLSGGHAPAKDVFYPSEADSITSGCSGPAAAGVKSTNFLAFVGSNEISPPAELLIYNDSTCSGAIVGRVPLNDGLRHYRNGVTGSTIYLDSAPSASTTTLRFKFP